MSNYGIYIVIALLGVIIGTATVTAALKKDVTPPTRTTGHIFASPLEK